MRKRLSTAVAVTLLPLATFASPGTDTDADGWLDTFPLDDLTLRTSGSNPYFRLKPGDYVVLGELERDGAEFVLITVLDETEVVDGVETRVVEEREYKDGYLVEVSRNFFATVEGTGDVFYFGEDVDDYKDRKVVGHSGVWRAGVGGARAGLFLPGKPAVGLKYYLELQSAVAMDRAEIMEVDARIETQVGTFEDCLVVTESSPLEPGDESYKRYAPGIGMIFDDGLELLRHGSRRRSENVIEIDIREGEMPAAPADVVRQARLGGEMREIKVELHHDRVVYAVEVFVQGDQYDVEVTEDGTVLRNEKD